MVGGKKIGREVPQLVVQQRRRAEAGPAILLELDAHHCVLMLGWKLADATLHIDLARTLRPLGNDLGCLSGAMGDLIEAQ